MSKDETGQQIFQSLIRKELIEAQSRRPGYSLRAFAKKLGVSAASLSEIIKGRRNVSAQMASKILGQLEVTPTERQEALDAMIAGAKPGVVRYTEIDVDQYHLISDWYHAAILSLVEIPSFKGTPVWISGRLGISKTDAAQALQRLTRLGMIERTSKGEYRSTGRSYKTSDEVVNLSLRKAHSQNLELARRSLEKDAIDERDFTAITMAIDPSQIPEAKKMIREFRDRVCAYLEGGKKKEVYKLCVQLLPLSQKRS